MMRIAANWDPETIGRAELIEMAKHKGEGSDSPEEVNVQCRISTERYVAAFGLIGCVHSFFTIVRMVGDACTRLCAYDCDHSHNRVNSSIVRIVCIHRLCKWSSGRLDSFAFAVDEGVE
jgi:hypothetical protein